ncbi:hypothetical protein, partial [Photobacterium sp. OFAV2-7]|uniref:hypothetical protein n=1 Tax=Photobacterium sp. OFAV2-7 TaxID=2917748 RepID=UPI001EF63BB8
MQQTTVSAIRKSVIGMLTVIFGLILPCAVTYNAFTITEKVMTNILDSPTLLSTASPDESSDNLLSSFETIKNQLDSNNDYVLLTALYLEQTNTKTFLNKQLMKAIVIHLGFAVMSIGLCFIVLGINDGGIHAGADAPLFNFNLKTGSTGLIAFIVGAAMASGG